MLKGVYLDEAGLDKSWVLERRVILLALYIIIGPHTGSDSSIIKKIIFLWAQCGLIDTCDVRNIFLEKKLRV